MNWDAVSVRCLGDFRLQLVFEDSKSGVLDCKPIIAKLCDPAVFQRVTIDRELGVVAWEGGIDIAPETAYSLAAKSPLPEWMERDEEAA
jgi:hypothetical protein